MAEFSIFAISVVFVGAFLVFLGVKSVSQGTVYTVERFGKYPHTLQPGRGYEIC